MKQHSGVERIEGNTVDRRSDDGAADNGAVNEVLNSIRASALNTGESAENTEQLGERLSACLEQLHQDFERGIVLVNDETTPEQYAAALEADKTAGQNWEALESKLRANQAELLKKAADLPGGACLIGVYENGDLAIRQRSQEIMNARWTKEWEDGAPNSDKGELLLLPHKEALARPGGRWASAAEIVQTVRARGYHVPTPYASPHYEKRGLVAASESVMGGHYVMSPDEKEERIATLEFGENVPDRVWGQAVYFSPDLKKTFVWRQSAGHRYAKLGAILWLRG